MGNDLNVITTGYYKNDKIEIKENDSVVLICKSFLRKTIILMDNTTIRKVMGTVLSNNRYEIIIEWKDGKLSQALIDDTIYNAILRKIK